MQTAFSASSAGPDRPALAQSTDQAAAFEGLLWLAGLVFALMLAAVVLAYVRKRLRASEPDQTHGFTLDRLRHMRDRGDLTTAEYEALRQKALEE